VIRDQRGMLRADALSLTVQRAARQRVSAEGQEGLVAFLDKRPPSWHED
jgi:1,4-dihydroxy-2-naphthoyl-CoA synthase